MTATKLVTGTVAGFVLVIDPENEKGKFEQLNFDDATKMSTRISELMRADNEFYKANPRLNYDPTETRFWTEFKRDDDGEIEQEFSYDPSGKTVIGTRAYRGMCKCGAISWMKFNDSNPHPDGTFTCADCNKEDPGLDYDFTNYDGMQEREY